jgi:hypothetical protein
MADEDERAPALSTPWRLDVPSVIMSGRALPRFFGTTLISVVLAVALAGCGGSGSTAGQSAPTTVTTAHPSAADRRIARHAQLKLTDFPSGWEQQDKSPSKSTLKCPAVEAARRAVSARQPSPDFVTGDSTQVSSTVYIFSDISSAKRAFDQLSGASTRRCIAHASAKYFAGKGKTKGVKVGQITSGQLSMPAVGDESVLGRVTIPITANGLSIDIYLDLVFAREGRGGAVLLFLDTVTPFDEALRNQLSRTLAGRLRTGFRVSTAAGTRS